MERETEESRRFSSASTYLSWTLSLTYASSMYTYTAGLSHMDLCVPGLDEGAF